jgi:hypothetical protein
MDESSSGFGVLPNTKKSASPTSTSTATITDWIRAFRLKWGGPSEVIR